MSNLCICPTCNQPVDEPEFTIDLDRNVLLTRNGSAVLTAKLAEILSVLHHAYPGPVARDRLMQKVYGLSIAVPDHRTLAVHISRLRRILTPLEFGIEGCVDGSYRLVAVKWLRSGRRKAAA